MSVLVATDLDRTMIYSKGARTLGADDRPTVCVEVHDGKRASFMTAAAAERLATVARDALVVPVTTRILEQYRRVQLPGVPPRFAIAANGAMLLIDGKADAGWSRRVASSLAGIFPLAAVWEQLSHVCSTEFTIKLRNAGGFFCYAVVHPHRLPAGFVDDVMGWTAERGWRTSLQGRKLYLVPEQLTKSAALAEVRSRVGAGLVLAAGDSVLDVDLLLAADRAIHPRHGELHDQGWSAPRVRCTQASGIGAGEEIVDWFAAQVEDAA